MILNLHGSPANFHEITQWPGCASAQGSHGLTFMNYTYTVLRYIHDIATGEFCNVGILLYSQQPQFLFCYTVEDLNRVKRFFPTTGDSLLTLLREIEDSVNKKRKPFIRAKSAIAIAYSVLPYDDSSLQWSNEGGGQSDDPEAVLMALFERHCKPYELCQHSRLS